MNKLVFSVVCLLCGMFATKAAPVDGPKITVVTIHSANHVTCVSKVFRNSTNQDVAVFLKDALAKKKVVAVKYDDDSSNICSQANSNVGHHPIGLQTRETVLHINAVNLGDVQLSKYIRFFKCLIM